MTSNRCVAFKMRIETQLDIFAVGRHPGKKIAVHYPACFSWNGRRRGPTQDQYSQPCAMFLKIVLLYADQSNRAHLRNRAAESCRICIADIPIPRRSGERE